MADIMRERKDRRDDTGIFPIIASSALYLLPRSACQKPFLCMYYARLAIFSQYSRDNSSAFESRKTLYNLFPYFDLGYRIIVFKI